MTENRTTEKRAQQKHYSRLHASVSSGVLTTNCACDVFYVYSFRITEMCWNETETKNFRTPNVYDECGSSAFLCSLSCLLQHFLHFFCCILCISRMNEAAKHKRRICMCYMFYILVLRSSFVLNIKCKMCTNTTKCAHDAQFNRLQTPES